MTTAKLVRFHQPREGKQVLTRVCKSSTIVRMDDSPCTRGHALLGSISQDTLYGRTGIENCALR